MGSRWSKLASTAAILVLLASETAADPLDHWTRLSLPGAPNLRAVAYGNGRFVATGDNGAIYTSTNAFSWRECQSDANGALWSVTYGNGVFVTAEFAGALNQVLTSADGTSWTSTPFAADPPLRDIAFANGIFFAAQMDHNGGIATSQDGIHWSVTKTPYGNLACAYGNGLFLCAGPQAFTSVDATNWLETTFFWLFPGLPTIGSVAFGNGTFVGGAEYSGTAIPFTSLDGVHWIPWPQPGTRLTWATVTFGHDTFVMVGGDNGPILTSTTGTNWTVRAPGAFPDATLINVTYGNGRFVVVGWNGVILVSDHYGPPIAKISKSSAQGAMHLIVAAEKDRVCTIEKTVDLRTWTDLYHYTNSTEVLDFEDTTATNSFGIYRVAAE